MRKDVGVLICEYLAEARRHSKTNEAALVVLKLLDRRMDAQPVEAEGINGMMTGPVKNSH